MEITTLGIDLAKSVFQLHGVDAAGAVVLQKKLRRGSVLDFLGKLEPCLIGMEACATSHHWAREIAALGHDVRLIPPAYVKPYVKRQKNDAADAEAISAALAGRWRDLGDPTGRNQRHPNRCLGTVTPRAKTDPARDHCHRQQDRAHRMGHAGP